MPYDTFARTEEGRIIEEDWGGVFTRNLEKRRRFNPLGEDVYLLPDGRIIRDEDKIIAIQRSWKERVYVPGGKMYKKVLENWTRNASN